MERPAAARQVADRSILESRRTEADGLLIHYVASRGDGERLVLLLPELGLSWRQMEPLARRLASKVAVCAVDLPGFGSSARPDDVLDVEGHATVVGRLVDRLGVPRVGLVGGSFGAQVATELAARGHPAIASVVLQAPPVEPEARSVLRLAWRGLRLALSEDPALRRLVVQDYRRSGIRRLCLTGRSSLRYPIERRLPCIRVPALVLRADDDALVSGDWARRAAVLLPAGELAVLPHGGHSPSFTAPHEMASVIVPFIARTLPPGR